MEIEELKVGDVVQLRYPNRFGRIVKFRNGTLYPICVVLPNSSPIALIVYPTADQIVRIVPNEELVLMEL